MNCDGGMVHAIAAVTLCSQIAERMDAALLLVPESTLVETMADLQSIEVGGACT